MSDRLLVVDDEPSIRLLLRHLFEKRGWELFEACGREEALSLLRDGVRPTAILLGVSLPGSGGLELLSQVEELSPESAVLVVTGQEDVEQAVEAMRRGAADYLSKPFHLDEIVLRVERAVEQRGLREHFDFLSKRQRGESDAEYAIGPNEKMGRLFEDVELIARSPATTVLICGESGTGKEHIARRLHQLSERASRPFVDINASALPSELLESELFGHEAGAFTGAAGTKKGLFELAQRGTLFLDEIGDMDLRLQAKLLRVLQERQIRRVGGTASIPVDVRLVTATHRDLPKLVEEGLFRADLYYRLNVVPLYVPPLRERPDDIEVLVRHYLERFNRELRRRVTEVEPEALLALQQYSWPGNVRELRNLLERTLLLECDGTVLRRDHLRFMEERADGGGEIGAHSSLVEVEKAHITRVMVATHGNKNRAAGILGIDRLRSERVCAECCDCGAWSDRMRL